MWRPGQSIRQWPGISDLHFYESPYTCYLQKLSSKPKFCESCLSDSHALLKDINKNLPVLTMSLQICVKFDIEDTLRI
jgi:hypothetical protein